MEIVGKPSENSSDGVDVVDGIMTSCFRRQRSDNQESDLDGITEYQRRFNENVNETKNSKYDEFYSMDYKYKGYLLILAHSTFIVGDCEDRNPELDIAVLEKTFSKLDFEIKVCRDKTLNEIEAIIRKVSSMNFENHATLAVAISSHGKSNDRIAAHDAIYDPQKVLYEPFMKNRSLFGKPKMFFIGTCRGSKVDRGTTLLGPAVQTDSGSLLEEYTIPLEADVLKVYATVEGYVAYHNPRKHGSHFFRFLTEAMNENAHHDMHRVLTIANRKLATQFSSTSSVDEWDNNKQCLCYLSTLTRQIRFTK